MVYYGLWNLTDESGGRGQKARVLRNRKTFHRLQHFKESSCTVVFSGRYLVRWRLDSWTSISLLLKSLSSLRMAACRGETRRRREKRLQRLCRQPACSQPFSMLSASFRLKAPNDSAQRLSHHETPRFSPADTRRP